MKSWRLPILMYHKVADAPAGTKTAGHYVSPDLFARQLKLLRQLGYVGASLGDGIDKKGQKSISFTFDDGYQNFATNALPQLEPLGWTATVFLVVDDVGGVNRWDVEQGDVEEPLMGWQTVETAASKGIEFGSHTLSHARLAEIPSEKAAHEIVDSKAQLEARLKLPCRFFCYPYGSRNESVQATVQSAGYEAACATTKGMYGTTSNPYAAPRINVRSDTTPAVLLYKLLRSSRRDG